MSRREEHDAKVDSDWEAVPEWQAIVKRKDGTVNTAQNMIDGERSGSRNIEAKPRLRTRTPAG